MNELDWIGLDWIERKGSAIDEIPKDGKIDNLNIYIYIHIHICLLNILPATEHFAYY
jgi:hypothetical protein